MLVTGSAGFIAGHLIEHLFKNTDYTIVGIDRLDKTSNLNRVGEVVDAYPEWRSRYRFIWWDLKAPLTPALRTEIGPINYIFHLAASSHVDDSISNPLCYAFDNVIGTVNLLDYARNVDTLEYFQTFGTDEVYGTAPIGKCFDENAQIKARNPYAAYKASADAISYAFHNTYNLPIVISNTVNVLGEKQDVRKYLPLLIKKISKNEEVVIHAYPGAKTSGSRQYVHARNVAAACLFLSRNAHFGEKYNIPGQIELSNLELAQTVAEVMGKELKYRLDDKPSSRPGHDHRYCLDGTKLKSMGFEYPVPFWRSLHKTVKWYLQNPSWLND